MKLLQKEYPFKAGHPGQGVFSSNVQTFHDAEIKKIMRRPKTTEKVVNHEAAFRPSCKNRVKDFSYPEHQSDYPPNKMKKTSFKKG